MPKTKARRSSSVSTLLPAADEAATASCKPVQSANFEASGLIGYHPMAVTVNAVEDSYRPGCSLLWLSEAAMLEASLSASQLVAVAVKAFCSNNTSIQVESLEERVSRQHGLELEERPCKEPGSYVAVAVVWPSPKLNRYGAKLSKQLACTLGSPLIGLSIFVSSLKADCRNLDIERKWNISVPQGEKPDLLIFECKCLYLKWCLPTEAVDGSEKQRSTAMPTLNNHEDSSYSLSSPSCQLQTSTVLSKKSPMKTPPDPCTPSEQNLKSPDLRNSLPSGSEGKLKTKEREFQKEQEKRNVWKPVWSIFENAGRAKMIVEAFAAKWLQDCIFLSGNLILIPHCGHDCFFEIKESTTLSDMLEEVKTSRIPSHELSEAGITSKFGSLALTCSPQPAFYVSQNTKVCLLPPFERTETANACEASGSISQAPERRNTNAATKAGILRSSLGGLTEQISILREIMELSLLRPHQLKQFGLQPTRGVLLYGPPGSGKTSLACTAVSQLAVSMLCVNGPEIVSEFFGESEEALRKVFVSAQQTAPCVVFIDELDAITPERKEGSDELGQRLVAELLSLMDGGENLTFDRVLVIAATNRPEVIEPALRRPGRFDREIEVGVPTPAGRKEILETLLRTMNHNLSFNDIESLSAATHGFVGADMAALCNEAAMNALRRYVGGSFSEKAFLKRQSTLWKDVGGHKVGEGKLYTSHGVHFSDSVSISQDLVNREKISSICSSESNTVPPATLSPFRCGVNMEDFQIAKTKVRPSAMREVMLEVPKVRWYDIGGQDEVKQQLKEAVEWPQKHGDAFARIGAQPPRGVLLYGPPGCSKTLMARAVATETGLNFIAVKGPELFSKWVGESEKAVRSLFARARAAAPSVVFFDEIDGLAVAREDSHREGISVGDRVLSQLLVELDGLVPRSGVSVIAATNRPDKIDVALLRPGRLDRLLYVGPPDQASRYKIFEIHLRETPCGSDVKIQELAARTNDYTGADIAAACREAAMTALEEDLGSPEVCMRHFEVGLARAQPNDREFNSIFFTKFQRGFNTNL